MRIGMVVQRFGPGVEGGAERHCAMVAGRLAESADVEILTSTARSAGRWAEGGFPAGASRHEGLPVRRFPVVSRRGPLGLRYQWLRLVGRRPTAPASTQLAWLEAEGPWCPGLFDHLTAARERYDAFVFFTYLYPTTAVGLLRVADRAALVPTAHDEPALKLDVFRPLFLAPRVILYNTEEERDLCHRRFGNAHVPHLIAGVGVEAPPGPEPAPPGDRPGRDLVFLGRVTRNKLGELLPFFERWSSGRPDARLVLVGKPYMDVPQHPRIHVTGFVSEEEKWRWLRSARVFIMPSRYESLSMVLLEAWTVGTPALVTAECEVLAGHVRRSGGGRIYRSFEEFGHGLDALLDDTDGALRAGQAGRAYVSERYRWDAIMPRIHEGLAIAAGRATR